jgi:acetyl-CoA carboxylase biotin carboxyl carrier protein
MSGLTGKDVERILTLADATVSGEIDILTGDTRIVVRLGSVKASGSQASVATTKPAPQLRGTEASVVAVDKGKTIDAAQGTPVASPLVGTFYRSPRPGAPPFVKPGDRVEPDTVIGIVELMKLMNSVPAGISGEVVEMLVTDGTVVQTGDFLMIVRPE